MTAPGYRGESGSAASFRLGRRKIRWSARRSSAQSHRPAGLGRSKAPADPHGACRRADRRRIARGHPVEAASIASGRLRSGVTAWPQTIADLPSLRPATDYNAARIGGPTLGRPGRRRANPPNSAKRPPRLRDPGGRRAARRRQCWRRSGQHRRDWRPPAERMTGPRRAGQLR